MIIDSAEKFVASNEGCKLTAYLDPAGVPTIGYGTTRVNKLPVKLGMTITLQQAEECLQSDCDNIKIDLFHILTVDLKNNQVDALVDFCYELGINAFHGSTLYKVIENDMTVTEDLFTRWDKIHKDGQLIEVPGIKSRREREFLLFSKSEGA